MRRLITTSAGKPGGGKGKGKGKGKGRSRSKGKGKGRSKGDRGDRGKGGQGGKGKGKGKGQSRGKGKGKGRQFGGGGGSGIGSDTVARVSVTEPEVGITTYLNDAPGFRAILKQRYTDFIVREVDRSGHVVRLTEFERHESKKERLRKRARAKVEEMENRTWWSRYLAAGYGGSEEDEAAERKAKRARINTIQKELERKIDGRAAALAVDVLKWGHYLTGLGVGPGGSTVGTSVEVKPTAEHEEGLTKIEEMFDKKVAEEVRELLLYALKPKNRKEDKTVVHEVILPALTDKAKRTAAHMAFKQYYKNTLMCDTIEDPAGGKGKCIRVRKTKGPAPRRYGNDDSEATDNFDPRGANETWPEDRPDFLRFCLYKQNMDTMSAINQLTAWLRVKDNRIKYAGTKDKRAVTSQWVTAFKISAERMGQLNSQPDRFALGNFSYVKEALQLGQLSGNHFSIVLRRATPLSAIQAMAANPPAPSPAPPPAPAVDPSKKLSRSEHRRLFLTPQAVKEATSNLPPMPKVDAEEVKEVVSAAAAAWQTKGFVNYFGLQRFGTGATPSHVIGKALLQNDWAAVVKLILEIPAAERAETAKEGDKAAAADESADAQASADAKASADSKADTKADASPSPSPSAGVGHPGERRARELYMEGNIGAALSQMPPWCTAECAVLRGLETHGSSALLNAIDCVPHALRLMYAHAYQSFVWNHCASLRLARFGADEAVVGDLVLLPRPDADADADADADVAMEEAVELDLVEGGAPVAPASKENNKRKQAVDGEAAEGAAKQEGEGEGESQAKNGGKPLPNVHVLTEADVAEGRFSIYDVVLPAPGWASVLPGNSLADDYLRMLKEDGFDSLDAFRSSAHPDYSLPGAYRKLLQRPADVSWKIVQYEDDALPLQHTDLSALEAGPSAVSSASSAGAAGPDLPEPEGIVADGSKCALIVNFTLPSSTYATMCLRELLKDSTEVAHHTNLNKSLATK